MPGGQDVNADEEHAETHEIWNRRIRDLAPFVIIVAGLVAALYFGQGVLKPLALAILVTTLINAATDKLTTIRIGSFRPSRWMGLTLTTLAMVAVVFVFARILTDQVEQLAADWPRYLTRLEALAAQITALMGAEIAGKVTEYIGSIDISSGVTVVLGTTGTLLTDLGMVALYTAFLISARDSGVRKLSALFPAKADHEAVTRILTSISESTRKYMLIKTAMSVLTGVASYVVMLFVGLDFAATWAVLIFLLNYIPTIGSIIGVILPCVLALVQFDAMSTVIITVALLGGIQFVIGNLIEPIYMGKTLNLSSVVVILALTLWGSLWGVFGMFLSVPLTVMIMISCAHIPPLRWFAIILSEDGKVAGEAA